MKYILIVLLAGLLPLKAATPDPTRFVTLDWNANPESDNVLYYTLYIGDWPNPPAHIELGPQTSIQVLLNHYHTYVAVTATNAVGESLRSNEVHIVNP